MFVSRSVGKRKSKGGGRSRKIALIEATNPNWDDLAERWFPAFPSLQQIPHAQGSSGSE
jgi:hypothetical protein